MRLRNTSNVLTLRMSVEQIRLLAPPKLFRVESTATSRGRSGSEFQTVGPVTEKCNGELAKLTVDYYYYYYMIYITPISRIESEALASLGGEHD